MLMRAQIEYEMEREISSYREIFKLFRHRVLVQVGEINREFYVAWLIFFFFFLFNAQVYCCSNDDESYWRECDSGKLSSLTIEMGDK